MKEFSQEIPDEALGENLKALWRRSVGTLEALQREIPKDFSHEISDLPDKP